jgi:hypothetical protein
LGSSRSGGAARGRDAHAGFDRGDIRAYDFRPQRVVSVLTVASHLDEPYLGEEAQVMRHRRLRDGERFAQMLARRVAASGNALEDRQSPCVSEGLGDTEELFCRERHATVSPSNRQLSI